MSTQTAHPRALITGASSGIGAAFAERLARDHYNLILVARRRDRLAALAQKLQSEYHVTVEVLAADLSKHTDLLTVENRITEDSNLEMLINNAGFGGYMPFVSLDPNRAEELINVQVLAVTRLTRAALPGMIARKYGSIINVSSRLAFSGPVTSPSMPRRATYAATKAYINTFTQILNDELKDTGVKVQALCPAVVITEFHKVQGIDPTHMPPEIIMQAEDLVDASLKGLELGEVICIPSLDDPTLLQQFEDSQRQMLMHSGTGVPAKRYST
jgi:short-subunit dehydrogenase